MNAGTGTASQHTVAYRYFVVIFFLILAGLIGGCPEPSEPYDLAGWRDVLKKNGKWHMVRLPDSKLVPGSIVKITKQDGLRWIDSLGSCGVPAELLVPVPPNASKPTLVVLGASPQIKFDKTVEFNSDALLNIAGVKAGPEFNKLGKVRLGIGENGGDAMRLVKLGAWIRDNAEQFDQACLDELAKPDRFLVSESFRFSAATYEMFDQNGAKLKLTVPQVGKIVQLEPSIGYSITTSGELRIEQTMYVAVRQAISTANGGFDTLGEDVPDEQLGDSLLEAHNAQLQ